MARSTDRATKQGHGESTMEHAQCSCSAISLIGILWTSVGTFVATWLVSYLSHKRQVSSKKSADFAGATAIIGAYLKEVDAGLAVIKQLSRGAGIPMPTNAWRSPCCRLTADMVATIVASDRKDAAYDGFKTCDFLEHIMNYFEYLCPNIDRAVQMNDPKLSSVLLEATDAASGVKAMLTRIQGNLKQKQK